MVDFTEILSKPVAAVEKPKPRPHGSYLGQLQGLPEQRTVSTKNGDTAVLSFKVKLLQAMDDVDKEKLEEMPPIHEWSAMPYDVWLNEQGLWPFKKFLSDVLEIDPGPEDNSKSFAEMIPETAGKTLLVTVQHEPYIDKNTNQPEIASRIKQVAKAV